MYISNRVDMIGVLITKTLIMKKLFALGMLVSLAACQSGDMKPTTSGSAYDLGASSSAYAGSGAAPGPVSGNGQSNVPAPKAGVITAGEWSDLANWSYWQNLLQKEDWSKFCTTWQLLPTDRYSCVIMSANGQPAADVRLSVLDNLQQVVWEGTTDLNGRVQITPQIFNKNATGPFAIQAVLGPQTLPLGILGSDKTYRLPAVVASAGTTMDVQLVVDATGSMGDEMEYLKNEFNDVVQQAQRQLPNVMFRMGSVFYRDKGDDYLTKPLPFTNDLSTVVQFISQQQAGGGGDFPEAVDDGLDVALNQQWSPGARSRLLFLVLDAPPHDTPETVKRIGDLVKKAGKMGVRIIPITASGIDKPTEALMRTMAIGTQGTYVFITNDSGIGNPHLEPTVGDYKVEYLNDLMTRLIVKYGNP